MPHPDANPNPSPSSPSLSYYTTQTLPSRRHPPASVAASSNDEMIMLAMQANEKKRRGSTQSVDTSRPARHFDVGERVKHDTGYGVSIPIAPLSSPCRY